MGYISVQGIVAARYSLVSTLVPTLGKTPFLLESSPNCDETRIGKAVDKWNTYLSCMRLWGGCPAQGSGKSTLWQVGNSE